MKKNAFTLIELLAVIVILAVIALIATPLILNTIDKAKKGAFESTAYGIINAAELYYTESLYQNDGDFEEKTFSFPNSEGLNYKGERPSSGNLIISNKGEIDLAIYNGTWCATKMHTDLKVTLKKTSKDVCKLKSSSMVTIDEIKNTGELIDQKYYFRGENSHNWIRFNNELWRILSIENNIIKIVKADSIGQYSWGVDVNDWTLPSTLKTYLNETWLNTLGSSKDHLEKGSFSIGPLKWQAKTVVEAKAEEDAKKWVGYVGLISPSDYAYASKDSTCQQNIYMNENCKNENWLFRSSMQWTMNGKTDDTKRVWDIGPNGRFYADYISSPFDTYPVIFLKGNTNFMINSSSPGSKEDPYIVK